MKKIIKAYLLYSFFLCFAFSTTDARTLHVPTDFKTIQQALNAAQSNDIICIKNGSYRENIVWPKISGIQMSGENKTQTIIDGNHVSSVLIFDESLEGIIDQKTQISNLSIINGQADIKSFYRGGGVYCNGASPQFVNVIIKENSAEHGGGIYCVYSKMHLKQTAIVHNSAKSAGGLYCKNSTVTVSNVTLMNNTAASGIAIFVQKSTIDTFRTHLIQNHPIERTSISSAIFAYHSEITMAQTTLWNEQLPYEVYLSEYAEANAISIAYSNIRNNQQAINKTDHAKVYWGEGNYSHYPRPYQLSLEPTHDTGFSDTDRITRRTKNLQIQGFGNNNQTVVLLVDGNALSGATAVISADIFQFNIDLTEGTHDLSVHYQFQGDESFSASDSLSITIDATSPIITDISNAMTPVTNQKWHLYAKDKDPSVRFRYLVDQFADSQPKGSYTFIQMVQLDKTHYTDGIWYLHVQACDTAGNESDIVTVQTILDNTPPMIIGLADTLTPTTYKRWTWSAKDNDQTVLFRHVIDSHKESKLEGPFNATHSAVVKDSEGLWYLHVQAQDRAGNMSHVVTVSVVLDNLPPNIVGIENDPIPKKQKTWVWQSNLNEKVTFRYVINQHAQSIIQSEFTDTNSATIKDVDGIWYLHVQARDEIGNMGDIQTVSAILDQSPPIILGLDNDDMPVQLKRWQWHTQENDPIKFRYIIDQFEDSEPGGAFTNVTSAQLSNVDGIWYLHVQAIDIAGNISNIVTVRAILDSTPPIIKGLSDNQIPQQALSWSWYAEDNDPQINYRFLVDEQLETQPTSSYTPVTRIDMSTGDGKKFLHVQAIDRAGNLSPVKTVVAILDNTAPIIKGLSNDNTFQKEKKWQWQVEDLDHDVVCRYIIDQNHNTTPSGPFSKQFNATMSNINGQWYIHVQAKDRAGNLSKVHHVYGYLDQVPPVITGLSDDRDGIPTKHKTFSWHAKDADSSIRFRFLVDQFYDAKPLGDFSTIQSTTINEKDGIWYLHVQAKDTAGNMSAVVTVKTCLDNTKPIITGLTSQVHPVKTIQWTWQAKDADDHIVYRHLITQNQKALPDGMYYSNTTASLTTGDGLWYLHVQAIDRAGNESHVATVSVLLDNTTPIISGLEDDPMPVQRKKWQWKGHDADPYLVYRYVISKKMSDRQTFGSYTHETSLDISDENQICYLYLQAKDRAGNLSEIIRVSAMLDNTPPTIKGLSNDPIPHGQKKWTWYSEPLEEQVSYQVSIDQIKDAPPSGGFRTNAEATIADGDGVWYLHVMAKDQAGNLSEKVTVSAIIDNTPPEIIGLSDNLYPVKSQTWTWSIKDNDPNVLHRYLIDQRSDASPSSSFTHVTTAYLSNTEGTWYIHVQAQDSAGNMSEVVTVSSVLDNTPPIINGLSTIPTPIQSKRWDWQIIDADDGVTCRHMFNQNPDAQLSNAYSDITYKTGQHVNGRWYLHVQAKDRAGNMSTVKTVWADFDTIPPIIEGLSHDTHFVQQKKWVWHGKDQDSEVSYRFAINRFEQYLPLGPFSNTTSAEISNNNGVFYLHVQAKDRADNISEVVTVSARLDTIAPVIIDIHDDAMPTQQKQWSWRARDDDPHVMYRYIITQNHEIKPSGPFAYTNTVSLSDGDGVYYLSIQAKDTAGNVSKIKTVSAILDHTAPVLVGLSDNPQPMKSISWRWYGKDTDAAILYRYAIDQNQTTQPTGSFTHINQASLSHTDGIWFIHVQAKDSANNLSEVVTVSTVMDNTIPVITHLANALTPTQAIQWQWQADDTDSYIQYRFQLDQLPNAVPTTSFTDQHDYELSNIDGTWYLHVQARDRAGNLSDVVTVSATIDVSSPILIGLIDDLTPVQTKVWSWDAVNEVKCLYRYTIDQIPETLPDGEFNDVSQATLKQCNGKWYIHVQAKDQAGNISPVFTALAMLDNQAPEISGLEDDQTPHQQKEWHWTSHDAHADVQYRYTIDQTPDTMPKGVFNYIKKARITDKDGTWYLHVQAKDFAGNLSHVMTVSTILDNQPPILTGLANDNQPSKHKQWQWSAQDVDNFIQYRYIIDKNFHTAPKNDFSHVTQAQIENENGLFYIHVQAQDRALNMSNVLTVHCVLDNTPPEIMHLSNDDTPTQVKKWQWDATDNDDDIDYRWLIDQRPDAEPTGSFTRTNETTISNGNGMWYLHIQAKDRAGNISVTKTVSAILDTIPPEIDGIADDSIPKKQIKWSWAARDADSHIVYRYHIDQQPKTNPSTNFSFVTDAQLSDMTGLWYLHVQAQDRAGNMSAVKTVSALIDNEKPLIKGLQDDLVPVQKKVWSWDAKDLDQHITFRYVINSFETDVPSGPFKEYRTAEVSEGDGKRYIHVQAIDRAGNISDVYTVFTILDNTPPVLGPMIDDIIPHKTKTWTWHAKDTDPKIQYRYAIDQNPTSIPSGAFQSLTQTTLSQKDGRWFIHIQAQDQAGNISQVKSVFAQMTTTDNPLHYDLNIHFYAAAIKPISHNRINALGQLLNKYPNAHAIIEAHTDNTGDEDKNLTLSQQRADYVRMYLIKNFNISSNRLISKGYGETRPITDNETPEGRLKNRRAEALIFYKE